MSLLVIKSKERLGIETIMIETGVMSDGGAILVINF